MQPPYLLVPTHDLDLFSVRELPWNSRTLWGLAFHGTIVNAVKAARGRLNAASLLDGIKLGATLPLLKMGFGEDPIESATFEMVEFERKLGVRSTLFVMPFQRHPGHIKPGLSAPPNRACYYDAGKYQDWFRSIADDGWEIGVHGIDSHLDVASARREKEEIERLVGRRVAGMRSHWLYHQGVETFRILREVGYTYDASPGSNTSIGWIEGQHLPYQANGLWILPLVVHDIALLKDRQVGPTLNEAKARVRRLLDEAAASQAVVTVLWHNNSFAAPRSWKALYEWILGEAMRDGAPILTAKEAIQSCADGAAARASN